MQDTNSPKDCKILLNEYTERRDKEKLQKGKLLSFDIEKNKENISVYNPTKPIIRGDKRYLIGRVEPIDSEESKLVFFEENDSFWHVVNEAPVLGLQDPFHIENIGGYHIVGGVRISKEDSKSYYETVFYRYKQSIFELIDENGSTVEPFAVGPKGMKDIRLIELGNGKIGVFTRPQGGAAGLGKIGYIEIKNLDELEKAIPRARIIENQFKADEWGGANELFVLSDGTIGILGHIAHSEDGIRHYYAMAFVYDPLTHRHSPMEILVTADDFPNVAPKKSDLGKVIFSGGMHRFADGTAELYVGVGDMKAGKILIEDPFCKYERQVSK